MGDGGELSATEIAVYRAFLRQPTIPRTVADAARDLGADENELDKAVLRLIEIGLLRRSPDGQDPADDDGDHPEPMWHEASRPGAPAPDELLAISPLLAEATELGAAELELASRRAELEMRRSAIRQAIPEWAQTLREASSPAAVDVVTDPVASANVMMHYAERCQRELLSVAPGRGPTRIDPRTRRANLYGLSRGVRVRALYQHIALRDRATRAYLREMAEQGAKIRVAASVPGRSLVVDREVALLRLPGSDPTSPGIVVVHEPNVVSWVVSTFEQLWAEASPLDELVDPASGVDPEIDQTRAAILRLMAEGEKDEAISRRLSISVRTCRRHIADYMAQIGATSRFQAGVIAARTGHLDPAAAG